MKKNLGRKMVALFMAAMMSIASFVCTPSMAVKAESATVTDAEEEIVDVQEEQVEQTEQTAEDEELIDIEVMAGEVPVDSEHFPDENFRKYVSENFDKDCSDSLSSEEINNVKELEVSFKKLSSLQGIEYFTNLERLSCGWNNLYNIDVSKNVNLTYLNCTSNKISNIDISNNIYLGYFCCEDNNIKNLDISKNVNLGNLNCSRNKIEALDLRNNKELTYLYCNKNKIYDLDINNCDKLGALHCDDIAIRNNDVSNKIRELYIQIRLDKNNQYDLSQIKWLDIDKIENLVFYYGFIYETQIDRKSNLTGSIISIIKHDKTEYPFGISSFEYNGKRIIMQYDINLDDEIPGEPLNRSDVDPGIFVVTADNEHFVAGIATKCSESDKKRLEYRWTANDENGNYVLISDWSKSEWIDWKPNKFGNYNLTAQVKVDRKITQIYSVETEYHYHPYIKGKCQLPYSAVAPGQPGYLIGVESYENPNQSYQFEMLILDCTLLAQGLPAWTYTTGKFTVPEGNAGWCVWNPQYGYYWTLFRIYDGAGNLIDEYCYPFVNAY